MLVRCVKIVDAFGDVVESYPGMTVGEIYPVLEISYSPDVSYVRVVDDDDTDSLWSPDMFDTVDDHIPRCWATALDNGGSLRLAPRPWLRNGYWTDQFAGEPVAVAEYEQGRAAVLADLTGQ